MEELSDPVIIGFVGAPHGVQGTVRVRSAGTGQHIRKGIEPVIDGVRRPILNVRQTPKGYLVDLEGVGDRSQAVELRGKEFVLDRSELDELNEEEFYVGDLIGMTAVNEIGRSLGIVQEVIENPAHEILVLQDKGTELYVPFTFEHVPHVDPENRSLTVVPPVED